MAVSAYALRLGVDRIQTKREALLAMAGAFTLHGSTDRLARQVGLFFSSERRTRNAVCPHHRSATLAASLWPVALTLENELFPEGKTARAVIDNLHESQQLRSAAVALQVRDGDGILAPWWLTPQLVYWSGKNGVAGSSHESLAGTLDTARFFTSQDEEEAKSILRARHADFVVVCDADRLLDNSYTVLGRTSEPSNQLAVTLFRTPSRSPNYLHLVFQNAYFKVYQVDKGMLK
jgi:hypothetical protein